MFHEVFFMKFMVLTNKPSHSEFKTRNLDKDCDRMSQLTLIQLMDADAIGLSFLFFDELIYEIEFNWRWARHLKKMARSFHCTSTFYPATIIYISNSFSLHHRQIPTYVGHESSPAIRLQSSRRRFKFSATPFLAFFLFVFFSFSFTSGSFRLAPKGNPVNKPDTLVSNFVH